MRSLWELFKRNSDFRRLVGAGLISLSGDWMLRIGVAYFVYDLTGSTLASAGTLLSTFIPSILFSSLAGVFVDRWNRKTTMITANLLMAVALIPLVWVKVPGDVWIVYAVTAVEGVIKLFFFPAEQAMVPRLVVDEDLTTANAMNGQIRELSRLIGSAVGGVVVASGGITALAIADAATYVIAAALVARIRSSGAVTQHIADADLSSAAHPISKVRRFSGEWVSGLRFARSRRDLQAVFVFTLIAMTGEGVMGTLFAPFVSDVLNGSSREFGLIASVQAIGGITGGLVAASLGQRVSPAAMFGFGALLFGFIDLVMFVYPLVWVSIWPAVVCMILVGVPGAVAMTGYNTLLQRGTIDAYRGRVFGALGVVQGIGVILGTVAAGLLGEAVGIVAVISFQGIGGMVAGLAVLRLLRRELRSGPIRAVRATGVSG